MISSRPLIGPPSLPPLETWKLGNFKTLILGKLETNPFFFGGGDAEFPSYRVFQFLGFQVSKGGRTNQRPGTDHVISGPMRGFKKSCIQ